MFRPVLGLPPVLPEPLVVAAAALTQLGDVWFLAVSLALLYWLGDRRIAANPRRVGATLLALAVGALAITVALKSLFAFPRPPAAGTATAPAWLPAPLGAAFVDAATGDGFGFPSGHALGATMVYGGLASFLDVWSRRERLAAAAAVVAAVALSRVAIGVHYPADVVAGVAAGLVGLELFRRVARSGFRPRPDRTFFLAGVLGVVAAAVAAAGGHGAETLEAGIAAGGGFGGYAVWRFRGTETAPLGVGAVAVGLGLVVALFAGALFVVAVGLPYVFGVVPDTTPFRLVAVAPLAFAAVALVVAWPTVAGRARASRARDDDVSELIAEAETETGERDRRE